MKNFRKFVILALSVLAITGTASAAIKVELKAPNFLIPLNISSGDQVSSAQLIGANLIIASTIESQTNGYASAMVYSYALDGTKQWELPIVGESISGPLVKDKSGNIYLLGASVPVAVSPSPTPVVSDPNIINPDNVQVETPVTPRNSLTNLNVWKISSTGQLIQSYSLPMNEVVNPMAIALTSSGLSITSYVGKKFIQVPMDFDGVFGSVNQIKSPKTKVLDSEFKSGTNKLKFLISSKSINGIPSWKPKRPIPVLIQYSKFGAIKGANYFQGIAQFVLFQGNIGVIVGSESTTGLGISIVKPLS